MELRDGSQHLSPTQDCDPVKKKTKLSRQTPWKVKLSILPGGNALICAVDVAMSAESV